MTLDQAQKLGLHVLHVLRPFCLKAEIAGSTRREKKDFINIEVVILPKNECARELADAINTTWGTPSIGKWPLQIHPHSSDLQFGYIHSYGAKLRHDLLYSHRASGVRATRFIQLEEEDQWRLLRGRRTAFGGWAESADVDRGRSVRALGQEILSAALEILIFPSAGRSGLQAPANAVLLILSIFGGETAKSPACAGKQQTESFYEMAGMARDWSFVRKLRESEVLKIRRLGERKLGTRKDIAAQFHITLRETFTRSFVEELGGTFEKRRNLGTRNCRTAVIGRF